MLLCVHVVHGSKFVPFSNCVIKGISRSEQYLSQAKLENLAVL